MCGWLTCLPQPAPFLVLEVISSRTFYSRLRVQLYAVHMTAQPASANVLKTSLNAHFNDEETKVVIQVSLMTKPYEWVYEEVFKVRLY